MIRLASMASRRDAEGERQARMPRVTAVVRLGRGVEYRQMQGVVSQINRNVRRSVAVCIISLSALRIMYTAWSVELIVQ
jgi:hypothetical protein